MKIAILITLLLSTMVCFAQPAIEWQHSFGGSSYDVANSIRQTSDGGFVVAGISESVDGDITGNKGWYDYWIAKLDSSGGIEWQRSLGGSSGDYGYAIDQTVDGGYVAAGYSASNDSDVTGNHGGTDYWVVRLDTLGNLEWQRSLGGSYNDYAYAIQQTDDGGFIVAGESESNDGDVSGNHGGIDYWVVKLSSSGGVEWQRSLGGTGDEEAYSIDQTGDGGYVVTGYTNSYDGDVSGNNGESDFWVVKLNSTGSIVWQRCLGGSSWESARSIRQTGDGGYIVAGRSFSNDGDVSGHHGVPGMNPDYWIAKLDSSGGIEWQNSLGGTFDDYAYSVEQTSDGGYIVAGYSMSDDGDASGNHGELDFWVVRLDSSGSLVWQRSLGGSQSDFATSVRQTGDGGYVVAGWARSNDGDASGNHGYEDYWVVKLASDTYIEETARPKEFALSTHPNPFNSAVTITVGEGLKPSRIEIFDINGYRISVISSEGFRPDEKYPSYPQEISPYGRNDNKSEFIWQPAPALGSGIYLVRAKFDDQTATMRVVYLK